MRDATISKYLAEQPSGKTHKRSLEGTRQKKMNKAAALRPSRIPAASTHRRVRDPATATGASAG
jgi:hypothetical protein